MTAHAPPALRWSARLIPVELRALLVGVIALFGAAAIAFIALAGYEQREVVIALGASVLSIAIAMWLAWLWDKPPSRGVQVALLLAAVSLTVAFGASAEPRTVLATGLPFAFAIAWLRSWWIPLTVGFVSVWGGAGLTQLTSTGSYPIQEAISMTILLGAATVVFTGTNIGWQLQVRLDQHHADQKELALARERLRFATDLHDIQGHTLLTIKLKTELTRRSLDRDPDLVRSELRGIEDLAAQADRQTRDIAQGYRTLNLIAELSNLEQLLTAAGIAVDIHRTGAPPQELDELFASLAREATSNILRHSGATTVRIYLSDTTLVIDNDGALSPAEDNPRGDGSGLAGLQRRFTDHGGTFTWQHDGDVFTVTGEVGAQP